MDVLQRFIGLEQDVQRKSYQVRKSASLVQIAIQRIGSELKEFPGVTDLNSGIKQDILRWLVSDTRNHIDESIELLLDPNTKHFDFSNSTKVQGRILQIIVDTCPEVVALSFSSALKFTPDDFQIVRQAYQECLQFLDISRCFIIDHFDDLHQMTNLQHLSIRGVKLCPRMVNELSQCHNLISLNMRMSQRPGTNHSPDIIRIVSNLPRLQHIDLSAFTSIQDDVILTLTNSCCDLKLIILRNCHQLTPLSIQHIGNNCPNLVVLDVVFPIDGSALMHLKKCPKLRILDLGSCELPDPGSNIDEAIIGIIESCPELELLDLSYLGIGDEVIRAIGNNCSHLQSLSLSGSSAIGLHLECLRKCVDLTHLDLSSNARMSNDAFFGLFHHHTFHSLVHLNLKDCAGIRPNVIEAITNQENLERLNLASVKVLTDDLALMIVERLVHLTHFDVRSCIMITNDGRQKILEANNFLSLYTTSSDQRMPATLGDP
eukprot:TRINITY_DN15164_c0_g1_i1.p1 TRINITY_DN15164_c0_g1~~TRINITY_DN15164_c0_g1_i1.p1  ORF type:complete len:488 (+),score=113.09 TRINITY_DN15164_c0_g1_i1:59-1522(+)